MSDKHADRKQTLYQDDSYPDLPLEQEALRLHIDDLVRLIPGSSALAVSQEWLENCLKAPRVSVYNQLYRWLETIGFADPDHDLHNRVFVSNKLEKQLLKIEKARTRKLHPNFDQERVALSCSWSNFGSGPHTSLANHEVVGDGLCVVPPEARPRVGSGSLDAASRNLFDQALKNREKRYRDIRRNLPRSSFFYWIVGCISHRDQIGDIARDIFLDKTFPKNVASYEKLEEYLRSQNASWKAISCAYDAWHVYTIQEESSEKVYFIQIGFDGPIKIGFTAGDVLDRLASLQTAHPQTLRVLAEIPGGRDKESDLHAQFAAHRIDPRREWFEAAPVLAWLSEVLT